MSHAHDHSNMLPKGALVFAGGLVFFALAATTLVRVTGTPAAASPVATRTVAGVAPIASRDLRFIDRADGAVVIEDAGKGGIAQVIAAGEETGFIRGVMRGLARDRHMRGIDDRPPFTLTLWENGHLSLTDRATGRSVELTAFGASNRAAFAALLPKAES